MLTAPPVPPTAAAPARTSDIPPQNAVYMLPSMCPEAGLPPTSVLGHPGSSARPEYQPGAPVNVLLDRVWAARARLPGLCLEYAAYAAAKMGQDDRALQLLAVGNVREAYDRARCLPDGESGYSQYGDFHGIARMLLSTDTTLFKTRATEWLRLSNVAAGQATTYAYAVDLKRVCDPSRLRPEAEWPALREKVAAAVLAAEASASAPKTEAPAGAISAPTSLPPAAPPSPPAPSGSRSPRP